MEADRTALCGPAGRHDAARVAGRAGSTTSRVVLGGREIGLRRLRVRSVGGRRAGPAELSAAAARDPLDRHTLEAIASGSRCGATGAASTRSRRRSASAGRSAAPCRGASWRSRRRGSALVPRAARRARSVRRDDRWHRVPGALRAPGAGHRHRRAEACAGAAEGTTENAAVAKALLGELIERGLDTDRPLLFVIDGSKALRKAIAETFGAAGTRAALPGPQAAQRPRAPARAAAPERREGDASGVGRLGRQARAASARTARGLARGTASQRRGLDPRGPRRDPHPPAARRSGRALPDAAQHECDREPEQRRRHLHAEREALARGPHDPALGRRGARRNAARLPSCPRARGSLEARSRTHPPRKPRSVSRKSRRMSQSEPPPAHRSSTANGTSPLCAGSRAGVLKGNSEEG